MSACRIERLPVSTTAVYSIEGRFEGAGAWELAARLKREPLGSVVVDFSRVGDFVDHAIAVLAAAIEQHAGKTIRLRGLRHHQARLFRYFGVDTPRPAAALDAELPSAASVIGAEALREVV